MNGLIDSQRAEGHAVESICRVLREQGCQVAARTYRSWKGTNRAVADRTVTDAQVSSTRSVTSPGRSTSTADASSRQRGSTDVGR